MRALGLIVVLLVPACSDEGNTGNSVDVSAAATRAESDIANYAAERRGLRRPSPTPTASPTAMTILADPDPLPASGGPVRAEPRQVAPAKP
jgi:hypothetical protein